MKLEAVTQRRMTCFSSFGVISDPIQNRSSRGTNKIKQNIWISPWIGWVGAVNRKWRKRFDYSDFVNTGAKKNGFNFTLIKKKSCCEIIFHRRSMPFNTGRVNRPTFDMSSFSESWIGKLWGFGSLHASAASSLSTSGWNGGKRDDRFLFI